MEKDSLSSRLFVLGQEKRLILVSPQPDSVISNKKSIPLIVNAYNSASKVKSVTYTITDETSTITEEKSLPKTSWFSFQEKLQTSKLTAGKYNISIKAADDQGQKWQKDAKFIVSAKEPIKPKSGQNWISFYGPDGKTRVSAEQPPPALRILWACPVGSAESGCIWYSNPLVYKGVVYAGVWDEEIASPQGGIAAIDIMTGKKLWKVNIGSVGHSPVIYNNHLYAITSEAILHCIDLNTKKIKWTYDIFEGHNHCYRFCRIPIAVADGRVFASADEGNIHCIDADTGKQIWKDHRGGVYGSVAGTFIDNNTAYFNDEHTLYARDAATGKEVWTHKLGYRQRGSGTVLVKDSVLYFAQRKFSTHDINNKGQIIWAVDDPGGKMTMPVVKDGRIYYSSANNLICKDADTGRDIWKIQTNSYMEDNKFQEILNSSSHTLTENYDFVGSDNGCLYVINLVGGKVLSKYFFGTPIKSSAAISGNMVFIGSTDGNLYALSPALTDKSEKQK